METFNVTQFRKLFPDVLNDFIYLDSACITIPCIMVIDRANYFLNNFPVCDRSVNFGSSMVESSIGKTRSEFGKYINCEFPSEEIVFTLNTTMAINTVLFGFDFKKGDKILTTNMEHNSVEVPLKILEKKGVIILRIDGTNDLDEKEVEKILFQNPDTKMFVASMVDNIFGIVRNIKPIIRLCHSIGVKVLIDGAQALAKTQIDVQDLGMDWMCFSFHKAFGMTGVGILYGKKWSLLKLVKPLIYGGGSIIPEKKNITLCPDIKRYEAGTLNNTNIIASSEAIELLKNLDWYGAKKHIQNLHSIINDGIQKIDGVELLYNKMNPYGKNNITGIANFVFTDEKIGSHEIAIILDEIARLSVRSGLHCNSHFYNHVYKTKHPEKGSMRISLCYYNTENEMNVLMDTISNIIKDFD